MPTYDYKCGKCDHVQEEMHPMAGPESAIKCNKCGSKRMKKDVCGCPGYVKGTDTPTQC